MHARPSPLPSPTGRGRTPYLLFNRHVFEVVFAQWIDHVALHFFTHWLVHGGVSNNQRRSLIVHNNLRLLVQFNTFVVIVGRTRRLDQIFKWLVAPARIVRTVFRCRTAEQGREEVVRIPVVAGPAHHDRLVFARFSALQVLAPLVGHNFGLYANLRPVSLNHFRHTTCVRVVRTLYRHRPQLDGEAFVLARFFQQRFRFLRIVGVVLNVVVITPHGWWDQVLGRNARALVNGFDDRFFVHRVSQRLTHFHVIERFLLGVEGEITHVQARLLQQVDIFVLLHARDVSRVWIRHHLT